MASPIAKGKQIGGRAGEKLKDMDHHDLVKSGFWISQMFVVAATIIGVYLAAHAGLKQAIIFDSLTSQESSYYLRKSLHDELADNVAALHAYNDDTLSRSPPQSELENNRPVLSRFVWDTMRYSPNTFEIPSPFLTGARRFHLKADEIVRKAEGRVYGAGYASQQLTALLDDVEANLLPNLRDNHEALAADLAAQGIDVTVLKETE
ncbi:hypothetical protein ACJO2E_02805 [Marinobacter sp. M1N3S26]|uniref:hypothetical protein n=1 Tax=unclassified Marinobacter TaxID=83889 RepID=UPI00387B0D56